MYIKYVLKYANDKNNILIKIYKTKISTVTWYSNTIVSSVYQNYEYTIIINVPNSKQFSNKIIIIIN